VVQHGMNAPGFDQEEQYKVKMSQTHPHPLEIQVNKKVRRKDGWIPTKGSSRVTTRSPEEPAAIALGRSTRVRALAYT
jgi:hypothetical protein